MTRLSSNGGAGGTNKTWLSTPTLFHHHPNYHPAMPSQASRPDLVTVSSRILAFLTLIVADSNASPILQTLESRGTGITSSDENLMSVKVRSPNRHLRNPRRWTDPVTIAEHFGMALCRCGRDRRLFRFHMEVRSSSSVHKHQYANSPDCVCRARFLRARGRPLHDFFTFIEAPPSSGLPLNQQRIGTTRAADIDSEGRRVGGPDPDDANGNVTEKDVLPAYEVKGGPPNYNQFLGVDSGTGANARSQITETVPVETRPQSQPVETGSGSTNLPTHPSPVSGLQPPRPPPPSYIPATATADASG